MLSLMVLCLIPVMGVNASIPSLNITGCEPGVGIKIHLDQSVKIDAVLGDGMWSIGDNTFIHNSFDHGLGICDNNSIYKKIALIEISDDEKYYNLTYLDLLNQNKDEIEVYTRWGDIKNDLLNKYGGMEINMTDDLFINSYEGDITKEMICNLYNKNYTKDGVINGEGNSYTYSSSFGGQWKYASGLTSLKTIYCKTPYISPKELNISFKEDKIIVNEKEFENLLK